MKSITVQYENAGVSDADLDQLGAKLKPQIEAVSAAYGTGYQSEYAFLSLPTDNAMHERVQQVVGDKQKLNPTMLIVIGIGGSNLGTIAVHEALRGILSNSFNPLSVYFADTTDSAYIGSILALADQELAAGNQIILTIISKSGTTTETIANAQLFVQLVQKYHPDDYGKYVVVITDKDSVLWQRAHEHAWDLLEIPKHVGGRYSVFSPVGLFPLGMLGIDSAGLLQGAQSIKDACCDPGVTKNPAALSAATLFYRHTKGAAIHDTFVFAVQLKSIGAWYRQLMAESIGKAESKTGTIINEGITPTVSVGTIDLHSVAQLYLGGPYDKFTTFLSVKKMPTDLMLAHNSPLAGLVDNLQGKSFNQILDAILCGTQKAYANNKRPFISVELPQISAYYIGQLLQAKMIKMVYLSYLLEINPFDQPQVELYKKETRKILAHE